MQDKVSYCGTRQKKKHLSIGREQIDCPHETKQTGLGLNETSIDSLVIKNVFYVVTV